MDNYFIKKEYQINPSNKTSEMKNQDFFWNERNRKISYVAQFYVYEIAHRIAIENKLKSVLDIGCGIATQLNAFFQKDFQIFGVDQSHAIDYCKRKFSSGTYIADNIEKQNFLLKTHLRKASLIICADIIEHLENPDCLLNYVKEFADLDSFIVISTPERDSKLGRGAIRPKNLYHIREWNFKEFEKYISCSGFTIIEHTNVYANKLVFDFPGLGWIVHKILWRLPLKDTQVVMAKLKQ